MIIPFRFNDNYFIVVNDAAKEGMSPEQLRWLETELQKSQAAKTRLVCLETLKTLRILRNP